MYMYMNNIYINTNVNRKGIVSTTEHPTEISA